MKKPFVIDIPYQDPAALFAPFARDPFALLLDSTSVGRYSYICLDPVETFTNAENIFDQLKDRLSQTRVNRADDLPPFQGGLVGYFGYELLHQLEDVPAKANDDISIPDVAFGFYDVIAAFDHEQEKAWIISIGSQARAEELLEKLNTAVAPSSFAPAKLNWTSDFTQDEYQASVQKVIDYIHAGDIFQANLTQRFQADLPDGFNHFGLYQNLRASNPAPFSAFLNFADFTIASSSPERFIQLKDGHVETCPIKGTRPRSDDPKLDQSNAHELRNSEKDRAENTMIVDLLRNDISKVCKPHSVDVPELCEVHSFATVHHLISTVTGQLKDEYDGLDLLKASFPGGSITGAPKVRAMEIISELEPVRRNVYCGAIGYIGCDGTMDTNIVIRTLIFKDNKACVQVGGGIVADSQPEAEYQETLDKARALFKAFEVVAK
ncbi:aminodeoxychorismate synthase component I [Terasakiella sp. A23]|uniref:aminodeoxychorismate synthase component I n=1 Tax=Terasakiella sp. FCG-A23 TaxID=3080561 RepID=UPI0029554EA2|nr:aminodeoxychorismate synthase component I [Terasakiella sp. A23]MDV7341652.1 aminodeoxychorismate synthase component I [Terasakiella sp. A23]